MKKFLLSLCVLTAGLTALGNTDAECRYLTFTLTDGTECSALCEGLTMTVADGALEVRSGTDVKVLPLADLLGMRFTAEMSGIDEPVAADGSVEVYGLDGVSLGSKASRAEAARSLSRGVYILKTDRGTEKIRADK